MKQFEYKTLEVPVTGWYWGGKIDAQAMTDRLNELGKEGWQVSAMNETNMWRGASRALIIILQKEIQPPQHETTNSSR